MTGRRWLVLGPLIGCSAVMFLLLVLDQLARALLGAVEVVDRGNDRVIRALKWWARPQDEDDLNG